MSVDPVSNYKTDRSVDSVETNESKNGGREPSQGTVLQQTNRANNYDLQSHKSTQRLPDSRMPDSREQLYYHLHAWEGMSHE